MLVPGKFKLMLVEERSRYDIKERSGLNTVNYRYIRGSCIEFPGCKWVVGVFCLPESLNISPSVRSKIVPSPKKLISMISDQVKLDNTTLTEQSRQPPFPSDAVIRHVIDSVELSDQELIDLLRRAFINTEMVHFRYELSSAIDDILTTDVLPEKLTYYNYEFED